MKRMNGFGCAVAALMLSMVAGCGEPDLEATDAAGDAGAEIETTALAAIKKLAPGKSCSSNSQCSSNICTAGQSGKVCCVSRCGSDSLCNRAGSCKLKDGEACGSIGDRTCLHRCVGNCESTGDYCLRDSECPAGDICLEDAPECHL